jgi:MFS family permease
MSRRPLVALLTANAVSTAGTSMTLLAVPWFVLQTTGSAAQTGVVGACETVPLVLASALGGPLIDRLGARRVAVASDLLSAGGVAAVPLLHATGGLRFWQLCLIVAFVGLARAPGDTARAVLVPGLVRLAAVPLERVTSAYDGVSRGARMVGAPVAGGLIAAIGPADVLLVDAATFLASALLLAGAIPATVRPAVRQAAEGYLTSLREGLQALRRDRLIAGITAMVLVTNLLDAAWAGVLLPVYAREVLHSSVALGVLFGCFGAGALTGTLVYGVLGPRLPRWPVFTAAFLVVGAPRLAVLSLEPPYAVIVVTALVTGLAAGALNPVLAAVEYERIPEHLQSRVFGVTAAGCLAGMPVGILLAGFAAESLGLRTALLIAAGLYLLATLSPLVWPVWREMDGGRGSSPEERRRADRVQGDEHAALQPRALAVEHDEDGHEDRQRQHAYQQR